MLRIAFRFKYWYLRISAGLGWELISRGARNN